MAPRRQRRTAEDLANEHANKSLKLRENVARERVVACMRFEPACVASVLDSLRDIGTLDRIDAVHPPKRINGMLPLEDDPDMQADRSTRVAAMVYPYRAMSASAVPSTIGYDDDASSCGTNCTPSPTKSQSAGLDPALLHRDR